MRRQNTNGIMTPAMERTLYMNYAMRKVKNYLFWGCVNACLLSVVLYDIIYTCPFYSNAFHYVEWAIAFILGLNTLFHFWRYLWINLNLQPVVVTPIQKKLLGMNNCDSFIKVQDVVSPIISTPDSCPTTPVNFSPCSWLSSPTITSLSDLDNSKIGSNYSVSSSSWVCLPGSPRRPPSFIDQSPAPVSPTSRYQNALNLVGVDSVTDEDSLSRYLKEYSRFEKSCAVGASMEQPSNLLSTFWSHPVTRSSAEAAPLLRRCAYQLATSTPEQATNIIRSSDEPGSPLHCDAEIWRRVKINPTSVTQWTANLRMWISQTILERLVSEIKSVNNTLQAYGLVDVCIGEVGLDRLRKAAQTPQVIQNIPSLPCLVPFLEVSPNQEYVVSRIRDLARGGCMSEFKWNSGGNWDRKEWAEHLPTDSALVLHLWATYLDSLLPPLPSMPDRHPFSSLYLVKSPCKPTKNPLVISQVTENPPHYQLVTGDEVYHVPKGRNNLFYTILLFLHHIKTKEHGMLGRMNLGRSGVNMLWVIES